MSKRNLIILLTKSPEKTYWLALILILAIASFLRFNGINWDHGFGFTPHPDERAIFMKVWEIEFPSLSNLSILFDQSASTWNPHWFPYGSLPIYLLKILQSIWEMITGSEVFDPRIMARSLSTLADLGTIVGTALLAKVCFSNRVSLLAALLVSFSVIHIQLSNFFAFDTFVSLFAVWTLFFLYRVAKKGRLRDSIIAGVLIGFGLASKISFFPIIGVFLFSHLIGSIAYYFEPQKNLFPISIAMKNMGIGLLIGLISFVLAEPYAILDWNQFIADTTEQSEMVRRIRDYPYTRQYIDTTPYLYQITQLGRWALGWPLTIIGLIGAVSVLVCKRHWILGTFTVTTVFALGFLLTSSNSILMILIASGFAFFILIINFILRGYKSLETTLILSWVIPYALIVGSFEVKFTRYLLPIIPLLVILGSAFLVQLTNSPKKYTRKIGYLGYILVIFSTVAFGLAYQNIYATPHPGVAASNWINQNVPRNSSLLKEHWEESLPDLEKYRLSELPIYDPDTLPKLNKMAESLSETDYLIIFSNRLYGTVTRIPERYPLMGGYYNALFSGDLGFKPVHIENSYMSLANIKIYEDSFSRPNLPSVDEAIFPKGGISINGGFADESFSVYDHPMVIIFLNFEKLEATKLKTIIEQNSMDFLSVNQYKVVPTSKEQTADLMMSESTKAGQQKGGTWSNIIHNDSTSNRYPILFWIACLTLISLISFPIGYLMFSTFDDKGYLFAKTLGLLMVCFIAWILSSLHIMGFGKSSLWLSIALVSTISIFITTKKYQEIFKYLSANWSKIISLEVLFLGSFLAFTLIRMMNPDLWHPYRGGEKPMDLAYLNAVVKSTYMPPYDPWFSGGYLNYYYWGHFIVASLIHLTGITTELAYNLAIATFFALSACSVYSIGRNILSRKKNPTKINPAIAGIISILFVCVLGNLDGLYQVWDSIRFGSNILTDFDYWRSSRMMLPDPPGHEITEFPFFTFLFADLHAHLISIPFTLLVVGISLHITRNNISNIWWKSLPTLSVLGLSVGCLAAINTWDVPIYTAIAIGSLLIAELRQIGGLNSLALFKVIWKSVYILTIAYFSFLPYHLNSVTFFNWIERTTNTTTFPQFISINGLFLVITFSWCIYSVYPFVTHQNMIKFSAKDLTERVYRSHPKILALFLITVLLFGYLIIALSSGMLGGAIPVSMLMIFLLVSSCFFIFKNSKSSYSDSFFPCLLAIGAFLVVIGVDIWRIEGDIDRMNTVFKVYLHVWVILGIAAAYFLYNLINQIINQISFSLKSILSYCWIIFIFLLVSGSLIYTTIGTADRVQDRFYKSVTTFTLDGYEFVRDGIYKDEKGDINLSADMAAIHWLRDNIEGSPVILEGVTPTYRWGGRISIHTGLPTVIGWEWHQQQQRWGYRNEINSRMADVNAIYTTPGFELAGNLIDKYGVKYILIGELEKLYYPSNGLRKIYDGLGGKLEKIYDDQGVIIMKVRDL